MSKLFSLNLAAFTIAFITTTTFSFSAFAANPQCSKKIEGISLDQSVGDITNTLQQMGLHDITCKQRSKVPCADRKKQMLSYATNVQGSLHKIGDKLARLTFDNTGKPISFAYEYYTDGPSTLKAHDENRSWEGWTYKDLIESRINEYCKDSTSEGVRVGCKYGSALTINVIYGEPHDKKDCTYKFNVMFRAVRNKPEAPTNHKIIETITLSK
ncbi:hypothetical protein [Methylophaga nitratireducenticrescens]|uniref:Uncharacterized protein n=1 Tax=Methylophaga nitratireducenticrescens TaxID=754476 RepID=I1XGV4_METNJ|nr:hypothetical protein [Methylophaga nitratireducenticrescens]AFI83623.1 hypothetical protein Q7A_778 [Methylophaga nitratireducenticrescens]AUZ83678.1 hypothetical protein CDW43_03415 [Methylophaga nitratireducenticrescens]